MGRQQDPPGFDVVVHHSPNLLIATLVCQAASANVYRLQLLAQAR